MTTATTPAKVAQVQQALAPTFDWDTLPEATAVVYTRGPVVKDVEKTTPAAIIAKLKESFEAYKPAGHDEAAPTKVVLSWRTQPCASKEQAAAFVKLAKEYAKYCTPKMTLRVKLDEKTPTVVVFMAKPFEAKETPAA